MDEKQLLAIKPGMTIVYHDGRLGHCGVKAVVLSVSDLGMIVSFEDRADVTVIRFSDRSWTDYIRLPV